MTDSPDLYKVLQVDPDAESEVIRAAYRALAQKHHPDMGGSMERMTAINAAWRVLGEPSRRVEYDRRTRINRAGQRWDAYAYADPYAKPTAAAPASESAVSPAGGAPGPTAFEFGRYAGWTIEEVAAHDPDFLEWFARTPLGRRYRSTIDESLRARQGPAVGTAPRDGRDRGRRR